MPFNQDVDYVGNTVGGGMILLTDGLEPEVEEGALTFLMFLMDLSTSPVGTRLPATYPLRSPALTTWKRKAGSKKPDLCRC